MSPKLGLLHPGQMGVSVAASARDGGATVFWVSEGRSAQTHERALKAGLVDAGSVTDLCETCSIILSVCPPHAAEVVAEQVMSTGFSGLYLDANAISPERVRRTGRRMVDAGVGFVDGGIIGGPAWEPGTTLYLSGGQAAAVASLFSAGPLETVVIGDEVGKASALKMCYAANTKGTTALLCAVLATAESLGVRGELQHQWAREGSHLAETAGPRVQRVTRKAWRFAGEMDEISSTMRSAGLPGGFHEAAASIYRRITGFKDAAILPELEEVLEALLAEPGHVQEQG